MIGALQLFFSGGEILKIYHRKKNVDGGGVIHTQTRVKTIYKSQKTNLT